MINLLIHDLQCATTVKDASLAYHAIIRMVQDEDSRVWYEQMYFKRLEQIKLLDLPTISDESD